MAMIHEEASIDLDGPCLPQGSVTRAFSRHFVTVIERNLSLLSQLSTDFALSTLISPAHWSVQAFLYPRHSFH